MNIWIDAQLPPTLANWLTNAFRIEAKALRDFGKLYGVDSVFPIQDCHEPTLTIIANAFQAEDHLLEQLR